MKRATMSCLIGEIWLYIFQKNMALFSFFLMFAAALGYKRQEPNSLIPPQAFGIAQNELVNMDRTTRRSVNS